MTFNIKSQLPFTALIADDEPLARQRMRRLLSSEELRCLITTLPEEARNGKETIDAASRLQPDIIFLDIHMPEPDGIAVANLLSEFKHPPEIIYCTAYEHHAVEAFRIGAVDYLLKPIQRKRLTEAIERVISKLQQQTSVTKTSIEISSGTGSQYIAAEDIICLCAEEKYTRIYCKMGSVLTSTSLKNLIKRLPKKFFQIHRKTIIALSALNAIEKNNNGWQVKLDFMDSAFSVSRRNITQLKKAIKSQEKRM